MENYQDQSERWKNELFLKLFMAKAKKREADRKFEELLKRLDALQEKVRLYKKSK
jgi:hypothetical protein